MLTRGGRWGSIPFPGDSLRAERADSPEPGGNASRAPPGYCRSVSP
ncbi:hypothetical protein YDYSG_44520 [Paenibacillus tyrfis]|nr:hypothetical protein YDYSG_44520 [Paenibacillus tyrfis]